MGTARKTYHSLQQIKRYDLIVPEVWISAQICQEQICIYPKGIVQDSTMWLPAEMTNIIHAQIKCTNIVQYSTAENQGSVPQAHK